MTRQPEGKLVAKIQAFLRAEGARPFKIQGGADSFQEVGIPDILACYEGRFYGLEVKIPPNKESAIQLKVLREIREAGGVGAVVTSVEDVRDLLTYDPGWIAGFYEGEGCTYVTNKSRRPRLAVSITQKDQAPLRYIQGYFGGVINKASSPGCYNLRIRAGEEVMRFLETIGPRLKSSYKRKQIRVAVRQVEEATGESYSSLHDLLISRSKSSKR